MITRCPACATMFNVVADQLKVSEGWVRCGHCSDVFDASLHLQDVGMFANVGSQSAAAVTSSPAFMQPAQPDPLQANAEQAAPPGDLHDLNDLNDLNDEFAKSLQAAVEASAAARDPAEELPASQSALLTEPQNPAQVAMPVTRPAVDSSRSWLNDEIEAEESAAAADSASFVQHARRQAYWEKFWVRAMLMLAAFCLTVALVLQAMVHQKDQLVAWAPQLKPFVQTVCDQLDCQLAPLRKIDAVVIDSSTFNKLGIDSYKLDFSIKNLGSVAVAMPALEVTLTDTQDQALLRRVLLPAQFGAGTALLIPGSDFSGFITLDVSALSAQRNGSPPAPRVAGFRLLAFYP